MKNKKDFIFLTLISLSLAVSVVSVMLYFIPSKKTLSATEIYEQSLYSVVEVKAESENVGESFGTGEIISSVSIYTYKDVSARGIAQEASNFMSPIWEYRHQSGYFNHYHLGNLSIRGENHSVCKSHAFYGFPVA